MTVRLTAAFLFLACLVAGCSMNPPKKSDPVEVSGTVSLPNGQPANYVAITFLPTSSDQMQGGGNVKSGRFTAKLTPGKYTFVLEGAGARAIPQKYQSNRSENAVEIPATGTSGLEIKLTN